MYHKYVSFHGTIQSIFKVSFIALYAEFKQILSSNDIQKQPLIKEFFISNAELYSRIYHIEFDYKKNEQLINNLLTKISTFDIDEQRKEVQEISLSKEDRFSMIKGKLNWLTLQFYDEAGMNYSLINFLFANINLLSIYHKIKGLQT